MMVGEMFLDWAAVYNNLISLMHVDYETLREMLYVFEHKMWYIVIHIPYTGIVVFWHISYIPTDYVESNFLWYPLVFYNSNIYEILLYSHQLVVITYELINVVRAAHH